LAFAREEDWIQAPCRDLVFLAICKPGATLACNLDKDTTKQESRIMKIDSGSDWISINRSAANRAHDAGASAAFAAAMAETGGKSGDAAGRADFTAMTRQEMRDWMNEEIMAGRMTVEISSPFITMTLQFDGFGAATDLDRERVDFLDMARRGIESAHYFNDPDAAERYQAALDIMLARQEEA